MLNDVNLQKWLNMQKILISEQNQDLTELIEFYTDHQFAIKKEPDQQAVMPELAKEPYDLVLFDLTANSMPLDSTIPKVLTEHPNAKVCVIVHESCLFIDKIKNLGVHGILKTPFSKMDLSSVFLGCYKPERKDFAFKKLNVLIIEDSSGLRPEINSVLRSLGFKNVFNAANVKDALPLLEKNNIGWVISSIYANEEWNAFHVLRASLEHEKFKNLKITLLFNEDETVYIPTAYALGAMLCLEKPLTKAIMQQSFKEAIQIVNRYSGDFLPYTLKALRDYFKKQQTYEQLIRLEQSVIETFNQDAHLLLSYAEAQFLTGNVDEALISLNQANMIDPAIKQRSRDLAQKYVVDNDDEDKLPPIKSAVIVDSDVVVCNFIESVLTKLNAEKINVFHDGESAFEWIKNNEEPTIIIMEWKLPKVTGPFLIQRINHLNYQKTNILICSSLIKKEDNTLLREMGATFSIQKPLSEKKLVAAVAMILQQERNPFASQQLEQKIKKLLASGSLHEAKVISKNFLHNKKITDSEKFAMNAEIAYYEGEYENCKKLVMKAIGAGGQNISWINLLGKCLMQLQDFKGAAKCFNRAQQISPLNIERLCNLANVSSEMGNHDESEEYIQKAEKLDKNGDIVSETKVKTAFNSGKINEAQKLFGELSNADNVIAYLNNQAVAFSRNDDFQNSIKIYIKALKSIPKDNKEYQSIVNYNLALTFAKTGDLEKALRASGAAAKFKESRVYNKAASLKDRIIDARVKGKKLELKLSSIEIKNSEDLDVEYDFEAKGYEFEPGELCLYGIFQPPTEVPRKLEMLLNKPMPKL